jgi:feruloyl esterase
MREHLVRILSLALNATTAVCHGAVGSVIDDPRQCHWNPFQLVCKPGQDPSTCITAAQASALKANEATLRDPVTGRYMFSGMSPGSEFDQIRFGYEDGLAPFGLANYEIAFNDPTWNGSTFNLHTDLPVLDQALGSISAIDPDLTAFKQLGGKLIEWHGWDDAAFTPGWTVKYYGQVVDKTGRGELRDVQDFYRLFMMPGVGHCGTGVGPDDIGAEDQTAVSHDPEHDIVSALEAWVEDGVAPLELIATGFNVVDVPSSGIYQQRPICPYPSEGKYKGVGDPLLATSWFCAQAMPSR